MIFRVLVFLVVDVILRRVLGNEFIGYSIV